MKLLTFIVTICLLFSCTAQKNNEILFGEYSSIKKSLDYNIILTSNFTFRYEIGFNESLIAKCNGKWEYNNFKDSLILRCDKEDSLANLTSTYMKKRENKFKILNKGKRLKNGKIVLIKYKNY